LAAGLRQLGGDSIKYEGLGRRVGSVAHPGTRR
jgi:hypothetical protein